MLQQQQEIVKNCIKKIIIGSIIAEYGIMELKDNSKQDLKQRANAAIAAIRNIQNYFIYNPKSNEDHVRLFKKEFIKSEIYTISELLTTVWGFDEITLEEIINAIKSNTSERKTVCINARFDTFDVEHIRLLRYAKSLGTKLVVLIDSDRRIITKGHHKLINTCSARIEQLQSIKYVDEVFVFDSDEELCEKVKSLCPDFIVIKPKHSNRKTIGSEYAKQVLAAPDYKINV